MKKIQKALSGLLAGLMLFTSVPVNALPFIASDSTTEVVETVKEESNPEIITEDIPIDETDESTSTITSEDSSTQEELSNSKNVIQQENTENEVELGQPIIETPSISNDSTSEVVDLTGWNIDLHVFLNGKEQSNNEINYLATSVRDSLSLEFQINYRKEANANGINYEPGDIQIKIPRVINWYGINTYRTPLLGLISSSQYWQSNSDDTSNNYTIFTNSEQILADTAFEGSLTITYDFSNDDYIYLVDNEKQSFIANINDSVFSNEIKFNYSSSKKVPPISDVKLEPIKPTNNLGVYDNYSKDYAYVEYKYKAIDNTEGFRPIYHNYAKLDLKSLPDDCIVYDQSLNEIPKTEEGYYLTQNMNETDKESVYGKYISSNYTYNFIVAYPYEKYKDTIQTLTIDVYGKYSINGSPHIAPRPIDWAYEKFMSSPYEKVFTQSTVVNLEEFYFNYGDEGDFGTKIDMRTVYKYPYYWNGNIFSSGKPADGIGAIDHLTATTTGDVIYWVISPETTGNTQDKIMRVGFDKMMYQKADGKYEFLSEENYYIQKFYIPNLYDINGNKYSEGTYVGYPIYGYPYDDYEFTYNVYARRAGESEFFLVKENIHSHIETFSFKPEDKIVEVYVDIYAPRGLEDAFKHLINNGSFEQYFGVKTIVTNPEFINNTKIYGFAYNDVLDLDFHSLTKIEKEDYSETLQNLGLDEYDKNKFGDYIQRDESYLWIEDKEIKGNTKIWNWEYPKKVQIDSEKRFQMKDVYSYGSIFPSALLPAKIYSAKLELILPKGAFVENIDEIDKSSIFLKYCTISNNEILSQKFPTAESWAEYCENKVSKPTVSINANGQQVITVSVNFDNEPFDARPLVTNEGFSLLQIPNSDISVPYDSILEYGKTFKLKSQITVVSDRGTTSFSDEESYTFTLNYSSYQEVKKEASSGNGYFTAGEIVADNNSQYQYKLKAVVGNDNDVTNLVFYDNLETAYDTNSYWQGQFLSIDTSYLNSKGYIGKIYYSENPNAKGFGEGETSWKEYSTGTPIIDSKIKETIISPNWPSNYDNNMTEENNYWEVSYPGVSGLAIKFDETTKLESASYDYIRFYNKNGENITAKVCEISSDKIGGTSLAGKTIIINDDYVKITMKTDGSGQYKGFSADVMTISEYEGATDNSKVKSIAVKVLDKEGAPAIIPANSLIQIIVNMKSPVDENIKSFAYNKCFTEWNAINGDTGSVIPHITGIKSNIMKVGLPDSIDNSTPSIQLNIKKEIQGTDEDFKNLELNPSAEYSFTITLVKQEANEDGSYDVIQGLLSNKEDLTIKGLSCGSWLISEADDNYFDFVDMVTAMSPDIIVDGITFEKTDKGYLLTISEDIGEDVFYDLKVINKIEPQRNYEEKDSKENFFKVLF